MALNATHFAAVWQMLAEYYGRDVNDSILAMLYRSLVKVAPQLTAAQFDYAVERAIANSRYMPTLAEILSEVYEPLWRVRKGEGPQLPAIDPAGASERLLGAYYTAQATRERWKQTQAAQAPQPGHFRLDRWEEIPGATLQPWQQRELEARRPQTGPVLSEEALRYLLPPWERP